jgi:hypothetical protein
MLLTQAIGRVTLDSPVTDLPVQHLRIKNVLINMATPGMTVAELLRMTRAELLDNRGLGPATLADLEATLARFNWQLRPKGASASNRASASANLIEALVLHGAISSLERKASPATTPLIVCRGCQVQPWRSAAARHSGIDAERTC